MLEGENSVNQIVAVLNATLHHESVKNAQEKLNQLALLPGFAGILLQVMCNDQMQSHIRNAAAIALKNFVRSNWSGEGDAPLPESEREQLRTRILDTMFQIPAFLRSQTTETVCQISRYDFPERWPRLIQVISGHLVNATAFDQLVAALSTLEQLVSRYRHEMRSNKLWQEIIVVVEAIAEPLTTLYTRMLQYIPRQGVPETLGPADRTHWLQILLLLSKIYHSLVSQDISPYFEDNLTPWMNGFLELLGVSLPDVERQSLDSEPNDLDRLKTEVCEIATLFSQRFDDIFIDYTRGFIEAVWQLLNTMDSRIRFDVFVNAALGFLAAICQRPQFKEIFEVEGVLKGICEGVIIKNLMLRPEDIEIYENEPFEFLKRDIEGSDLETRRRGATDFVRALCKLFEPQVFSILSGAIFAFLDEYQQNPAQNFAKKDVVYFLVSAMAAKGTTLRYGSTGTSELINVSDFFRRHVRDDLLAGSANDVPILRSDALKYLVLFRNQLSPELIVECVRGEDGRPESSIVRFLASQHVILHHYLAHALERLLLMKAPDTGIWHQKPLLNADNIPLVAIIDGLFNCFTLSVHAYETHYIMKAMMRAFTLINDDIARGAHVYVSRLGQMIEQAIRTAKNPLLMHFVFESLCVLIRKAYSKVEGGLDKHVIPIVELIMANDVADFTAYALQLIALLLDQSQTERQHGAPVTQDQFVGFFPSLFKPEFWSRSANFPALVRVFEAFIRCVPQLVFSANHSDQVFAILQRLIASKANDQHGFRLANACIPHLDKFENSKLNSRDVLLTMLNRLNQAKTSKCSRQFTLFIFRFAAVGGGEALAKALNGIQMGLFGMVLEKIVVPEMRGMPQYTSYEEKRIVTIGCAALITSTVGILGAIYPELVECIVGILEAFDPRTVSTKEAAAGTSAGALADVDESQEANELEYTDPYCKLSYAQPSDAFFRDISNIKTHFAQAVLVTAQNTNPESLACLDNKVQNYLRAYLSA